MPRINALYEDEQQRHEDTTAAGEVGAEPDKDPARTRPMEPRSAAIANPTTRAARRALARCRMTSHGEPLGAG